MATLTEKTYHSQPESAGQGITLPAIARQVLRPLASLKLTVALFVMAIFIIWVGTLAQSQKDMWDVIQDYFWTPIAFIEFQFLFPYQWLPFEVDIPLAYGFPFLGGVTIGIAMAVNLLAAHLVRFKIQAKGMPLVWGSLITLIGAILTVVVIVSGHNSEGLQVDPPFSWESLWLYTRLGGVVLWLGLGWLLTRIDHAKQSLLSWIMIVATTLYGALLISFFTVLYSWYPGDAGMRIVWQLIQGGLAGVVILLGCLLLFKKRAGIVVIHLAVGLLLIGESYVSYNNVEERMQIREGEVTNYARDIRETELAVIDKSADGSQQHTVIPESFLQEDKPIENEELPFNVEVVKYYKNADFRAPKADEENLATAGSGLRFIPEEMTAATGTDMGGGVDFASAYVQVSDKQSGKPLGTYLVSQLLSLQDIYEKVEVNGKTYDLSLRFKRTYKPYSIYLHDVIKQDYAGTSKPKDYRSIITLVDPSRGVNRPEINIWMNNPLRYAGETFYQSNFIPAARPGGAEATDFQVVANTGWMIPYVACSMALIGMAYHFLLTLTRFTNRISSRELREQTAAANADDAGQPPAHAPVAIWSNLLTVGAVMLGLIVVGYSLKPDSRSDNAMDLTAFGELPAVYQGRTKPLETLARNTLQIISDRQSYEDLRGEKQSAVRWLLEIAANPQEADKYQVVRVQNQEVVEMLELEKTKRNRYSIEEIFANPKNFGEQLKQAHEAQERNSKGGPKLSAYQSGLLDLESRLKTYQVLVGAMRPVELTPIPAEKEIVEDPEALVALSSELRRLLQNMPDRMSRVQSMEPPLTVPDLDSGLWHPYSTQWEMAQARQRIPFVIETQEPPEVSPSAVAFHDIFAAYQNNNVKQFNTAVAQYQQLLQKVPEAEAMPTLSGFKLEFESFFMRANPFTYTWIIYLIAFGLSAVGMLVYNRDLNRAAFWLIVVGFIFHTLALIARIYISGRPPITNLYSSAVFIGWAGVLLCLILESIYRIGIVNLVGTVCGISTLIIASYLGLDGDTFTVMQAVLDTNFWLTTHVICVTLGYTTTFVAGALGAAWLIGRLFSPEFPYKEGKDIIRMCYGVVCFAIFFSFLGTVLGGLWADDSWGRFWGWDPKENGALIIVLWNAVILHARWGGMVKDRGLATLAVAGNIVTSWSWFGVNQLGIGLHSYGFTSGVILALGLFVLSQLAIMAFAVIPSQVIDAKPAGR